MFSFLVRKCLINILHIRKITVSEQTICFGVSIHKILHHTYRLLFLSRPWWTFVHEKRIAAGSFSLILDCVWVVAAQLEMLSHLLCHLSPDRPTSNIASFEYTSCVRPLKTALPSKFCTRAQNIWLRVAGSWLWLSSAESASAKTFGQSSWGTFSCCSPCLIPTTVNCRMNKLPQYQLTLQTCIS